MDKIDSQYERLLSTGWTIRSSSEISQPKELISRPGFNTSHWYSTSVPSTVLASLVENGVYKNPYFGMNLSKIPKEQFAESWWYRTQFHLSTGYASGIVLLEFDGINYSSDIWLNGNRIAASTEIQGAFRRFQFNISEFISEGTNALALEVFPPKPGDFSTGFVDWNPPPPDRNMGIFRSVRLRCCQDISIEQPFVQTRLNLETLQEATLTVTAKLANHSRQTISGILEGEIGSLRFSKATDIESQGRKTVEFTELKIKNPRIWWPYQLGRPNLHDLNLKFTAESEVCDLSHLKFGIREIRDYTNEDGHRGFKVNGKKILIKGAGWTDDLLLADTSLNIDAQLKYVRHMNLNCIRLEGIWGKDHTLYDLCDRYGILMMVGWSCHWEHEQYLGKPVDDRYGGVTSPEEIELIAQSWQDQVLWLRNHPSIFVWAVASDKVPKPKLERRYIETFQKYDPTRPYLVSTGGMGSEQHIIGHEPVVSNISGNSGVKMLGPYAYTPPVYWYTNKTLGGAYGFNTETSPGAVVPTLESIKKTIPEEHLWPIDDFWEFHCGLNEFRTLDRYRQALNRRYGEPACIEDFAFKAQVMNYELMRPMFEAFRANKGITTGIIQWMLNAAWPKMYWQLYDKYLMPTGAFYASRKACEPLHLLYNYGDRGIYIVNDHISAYRNLIASIHVMDINSTGVFNKTFEIDAESQSSAKIFELPILNNISSTYFLDLRLKNEKGVEISNNFYWLSTRLDVLDYDSKVEPWRYYTPSKEYADLTALNSLTPAKVHSKYHAEITGEQRKITATLHNTSDTIAFFIELKITDKNTGQSILPVFWDDNYVSLLPGETRILEATFPVTKGQAILTIDGWNLENETKV
jgi:exo-1,4-beta-D-glucosaminidase